MKIKEKYEIKQNIFHKHLKCGILLLATENYMYSFVIGKEL
jgi:hypothetical protein